MIWKKDRRQSENEAVNVSQEDTVIENENDVQQEVYEDEVYQEYTPRYATYTNKSRSITQTFLKKKMPVILVLLVVCTVGVVVGLSIHFTSVSPITTVRPTTTMSRTTTVSPNEMTSAESTLFSITTTTTTRTTTTTKTTTTQSE